MSPERFLLRVEGLTMDMDPSSPDQGMQVNTLKWTGDVILSDALFKYLLVPFKPLSENKKV